MMQELTVFSGLAHVCVQDAQVVCAAGSDAAQIIADVQNGYTHASEQEGWFTTVNVRNPSAIIAANIAGLRSLEPAERMLEMLLVWLEKIRWPEQAPARIYLLAPVDLIDWLKPNTPFDNAQWQWFSSLTQCLTDWNTRLENTPPKPGSDENDTLLLLALDSQIQPEAWYDQRADLHHAGNTEGNIVGEALVALWIKEASHVGASAYACEEPKAQLAAEDTTEALKALFDQAPVAELSTLLTNHNHTRLHACELHYFNSQVLFARQPQFTEPEQADAAEDSLFYLYPPPVEPPLRDEPQSLTACLGDLRLATLPAQLALVHLSQCYANAIEPWQGLICFDQNQRIYWPCATSNHNPMESGDTEQ